MQFQRVLPSQEVTKCEKHDVIEFLVGESNLLSSRKRHVDLAAYMEAETQLDSEKMNEDFLQSFREKDPKDPKIIKSCLSLKDLIQAPENVLCKSDGMKSLAVTFVNKGPESPSNIKKGGREGSNVVNLRKCSTMIGIDKKDLEPAESKQKFTE